MNRTGPRTLPCGTPFIMSDKVETIDPILTNYFPLSKELQIQRFS